MLDDPKGAMAKFYNNPDVQKALNVEPIGKFWIECMPGAGRRRRRRLSKKDHRRRLEEDINDNELPGKTLLEHDQPESVIPYVAELLDDADIRVLIYNGDRDMTTNSQGSEYLLDHMNWSGANGWSNITEYNRGLWLPRYDNKKVGGYMKQYKNLEFLVVINSGHLVPYNEPQTALELITRFLGNESFIDKVLPKFNIQTSNVENNKTSNSIVSNNNNNDNNNDDDVIENSYNEHYESIIHTNHNHTNKNSIYGIETALIAFIFFIFGFFISRKFPAKNKYRQGYDIIQSVAELN